MLAVFHSSLMLCWLLAQSGQPQEASLAASSADGGSEAALLEHSTEDVVVVGRRRASVTSAAHYELELRQLRVIPRRNVSEQLMLAPGVLTTNHGGEGHAHETYMRGFASNEGQNIEYLLDGIPLNEVSNPHNHGYTDIYFFPPELVQSLSISEGVFDPVQGDFAFAGSAEYRLGLDERGTRLTHAHGIFDTHRVLALYAPPDEDPGTFAAFEMHRSAGYGANRASQRALALGRYSGYSSARDLSYSLSVYGYATRYDQAGVLRQDDYEAGRIGFFDTYDPNQGGESSRLLLAVNLQSGPESARFEQVSFVGYRNMRLRANFTGWLTDDPLDEHGAIRSMQRGDNLEMRYKVMTAGSRGHYTLRERLWHAEQELSLGYALRFDQGDASQHRLRAVTAIPYAQLFDNSFSVLNIAGWSRLQLRLTSWLALRGGLRLDTFSFGVLDHNQPEADREGVRSSTQSSQSFGFALNPRLTVDARLIPGMHLIASYGQGTRSSDASALSDNETAPFARAQEFDLGLAHRSRFWGDAVSMQTQLSYSHTQVDKDLLFSELEGRNILVGASTRHAVLGSTRVNALGFLDVLLNFGWTQATLDATGELFPYIPRLVARVDAVVSGVLGSLRFAHRPVTGHVGLGYTYVPGRPLPLREFGDTISVLNLGGEIRLWHLGLGLEIRNLLNTRYSQVDYNYASNFVSPQAVSSRVAARHFVAAEPLFVLASLTWHIEDMIRQSGQIESQAQVVQTKANTQGASR